MDAVNRTAAEKIVHLLRAIATELRDPVSDIAKQADNVATYAAILERVVLNEDGARLLREAHTSGGQAPGPVLRMTAEPRLPGGGHGLWALYRRESIAGQPEPTRGEMVRLALSIVTRALFGPRPWTKLERAM